MKYVDWIEGYQRNWKRSMKNSWKMKIVSKVQNLGTLVQMYFV